MLSKSLTWNNAIGIYERFAGISDSFQNILLLLFRLNWGWQFYESGIGKLVNHHRTATYFTDLGIPLPAFNAWFVGGVECIGGILLLVGLASRPAGFVLTISMTVAYLTADKQTVLNFFANQDAFFQASPFMFLLSAVLVLSFGPGKISLDHLLKNYWEQKKLDSAPN